MMAFAANSILCRLALLDAQNDPVSFTMIRLLSGGLILLPILIRHRKLQSKAFSNRTLFPPVCLFSYAFFFSLAYVRMGSGTGALILFACVQLTMMLASFLRGQRLKTHETFGAALAICGFMYLLLPGFNRPPLFSAAMMAVAGISWGLYSLLGQKEPNAVFATARNFVFTIPIALIGVLVFPLQLNGQGILLAVFSGAITSALGYVLWYKVLKD
jgi:drug/metabolite transporter (DMT)-like permease